MEANQIIIPNGTTYNIKSITIKYLEETLIVTTIEDKIFTYDINDIRNIITHDNIYTLDFLDNDDLSFESNVELIFEKYSSFNSVKLFISNMIDDDINMNPIREYKESIHINNKL